MSINLAVTAVSVDSAQININKCKSSWDNMEWKIDGDVAEGAVEADTLCAR